MLTFSVFVTLEMFIHAFELFHPLLRKLLLTFLRLLDPLQCVIRVYVCVAQCSTL